MNSVRIDLTKRIEEATNYIEYIKKLENLGRPLSDTYNSLFPDSDILSLKTTMKASSCLILYNIVESTATKCLSRIHEIIISERLYYSGLNISIQKIILTYYENALYQIDDVSKNIEHRYKQIELIENRQCFDISFSDLTQYYQMFSGNLDGKQIKNILKRYNIIYEAKCAELKSVKDYRNTLAHGEMSFEEIGRQLSFQQIESFKDKISEYLNGMILKVEEYISAKGYKNTP